MIGEMLLAQMSPVPLKVIFQEAVIGTEVVHVIQTVWYPALIRVISLEEEVGKGAFHAIRALLVLTLVIFPEGVIEKEEGRVIRIPEIHQELLEVHERMVEGLFLEMEEVHPTLAVEMREDLVKLDIDQIR